MIKELDSIFLNVNNWLKFAETKNASLFAANIILLFGVIKLATETVTVPYLKVYFAYIFICLLVSTIICLISFIPFLNMPWKIKTKRNNLYYNLLFFADICSLTPELYIEKLHNSLYGEDVELKYNELERDMAEQIIINSKIAFYKCDLYSCAIWLSLSAIASPIITTILYFKINR